MPPRRPPLYHVLEALTALDLLTLGLLVFAAAQVTVMVRSERVRASEMKASQGRQGQMDAHFVLAEQRRIDALAVRWRQSDLILDSVRGVLESGDALPHDWAPLMHALVRLGPESGLLGARAVSEGSYVPHFAALIRDAVAAATVTNGTRDPVTMAALVRQQQPAAVEAEKALQDALEELSLGLSDALSVSPYGNVKSTLKFPSGLRSKIGRAFALNGPTSPSGQ